MASIDTETYLGGYGTEAQQDLFEAAASRIHDVYAARFPDAPEDGAGMTADELSGAAQYAFGDLTLADAGQAVRDAGLAYENALDVLGGAMCAAREDRYTVSQVAAEAGVTRASVYKRTEA